MEQLDQNFYFYFISSINVLFIPLKWPQNQGFFGHCLHKNSGMKTLFLLPPAL